MPKKSLSRLIRILTGAQDAEIAQWLSLEAGLSRLERFAHFWVLVWRSFVRNRCFVRASALSYTTLLAMIPLLAVAVSVTSSLLKNEGEQRIDQFIEKLVNSMTPPAVLATNVVAAAEPAPGTNSAALAELAYDAKAVTARREIARRIDEFVQTTRSGTLGVAGMILLVYAAIALLNSIEETFNDIWGVVRGRSWLRRIVLYWTTVTLGPVLLAAALGLASGPHFQTTREIIMRLPYGTFLFQLLPMFALWITFTFLYQLVPNTRVSFRAALVGGVVAGSLWYLNNMFGYLYVSRVATNFKIYGGLGLVPVFMIGLYFTWLILLFGAQIAYAYQNRAAYLQEKLAENVNQRGREFVALRLMTCMGQKFQTGQRPATVGEIATELAIPTRLVHQVMQTFLAAKLVVEVAGAETAYVPARPLESINAHDILLAMRAGQGQELATRDEPVRQEVYGEFARIQEAEKQAASAVTVLALVNRAQSRLQIAAPAKEQAGGRSSSSAARTDGADAVPPED